MIKLPSSDVAPADTFVLRAPLLPSSTLTTWGADLRAASASVAELAEAVEADRRVLLDRLRGIVDTPTFREAVFCASPTLDEALRGWLRDPAAPSAASVTPILVRYLSRMAGRSTPFGLFSSCGVGEVAGDVTSLSLEGAAIERHTRLDMQYLTGLVHALEQDEALRSALRFWPSSGLYRVGDVLHHAEAEMRGEPRERAFRLVSLDPNESLDVALERARDGATTSEIAQAIVREAPEVDLPSARAFVDELVESQILVSELSLPVTGPEPIHHVIAVLRRHESGDAVARVLEEVRDRMTAIDRDGVGQGDAAYREIAAELAKLPAPVELSRLFQVDLIRGAGASRLGRDVVAEAQRGIALLRRIAAPMREGDLETFVAAFRERYEEREVPLCEALDDEIGVGFGKGSRVPSELLEGLPFSEGEDVGGRVPWGPREIWLLRRLGETLASGKSAWELDHADVEALTTRLDVAAPNTIYATMTLASSSPEALAAGRFLVAMPTVGTGSANLFGRFCHGDRQLEAATRALVRVEEACAPDTIFAEIVHQPEGRVGNILCRPVLRDHEIPYLARSGVDAEHQIPIDDLLVSVAGGRVRLRSRRLGRWVEPRMSNAHNPRTVSLGVYRFLCALRAPRAAAHPSWSWGPLWDAPHLPRVTAGRLVLALEQWTLSAQDLEPFKKATGIVRHRALRSLRERLALPRWVALVDGDNILPVDLDNVLSAESFVDLVKGRSRATVTEVFPPPGDAPLAGPDGAHACEIVLPFATRSPPSPPRPVDPLPTVTRSFGPGSTWLYAKIYAGAATGDLLLRDVVAPTLARGLAGGAIDRWFFIRYADPHPHLRVRFHGDPRRLLAEVAGPLHDAVAPWLASGRVRRFELDTYVREIERYGGDDGIELCEVLFGHDSDAVLDAVCAFDGVHDSEVRWRVALVGMDRLLGDLGFDLLGKLALMTRIRDGFAKEHAVDAAFDRALGGRFRGVRSELEALVGEPPSRGDRTPGATMLPGLAEALARLNVRSDRIAPVTAQLRERAEAGRLTTSLADLAASLLHMHANRMLAADHRAQELVLYDLLLRIYESREARVRRAKGGGGS